MNGGINKITVFYDPDCGLCSRFRQWLRGQKLRVKVDFVGYNTPDAEALFPGIRKMEADREVIVLADSGNWWQGADAWLTCLWATVDYRAWSFRLSAAVFRPVLMQVVHLLSSNRMKLSKIMRLASDRELAHELSRESSGCDGDQCGTNPWRTALRKGGASS